MSANIKASTDGTQAIIGVGGVDQMTVSNAGVVTANSFVGNVTGGGTFSGNASSATALATGSTTARTLANRFADVVNVKDFGAVGDGTDATTAFNNAAIAANNQKSIFVPSGTYLISSAITTSGEWIIDTGATITGLSPLSDSQIPTATINNLSRLTGRILKIQNTEYGAGIQIGDSDPWLEQFIRPSAQSRAELSVLSPYGQIAITGASKIGDNPTTLGTDLACIGGNFYAINDRAPVGSETTTAYAIYAEARRRNGGNAAFGMEVDIANQEATVPFTPNSTLSPSIAYTGGILINSGAGLFPASLNPASFGLAFGNNGDSFYRGIVFNDFCLDGTGPLEAISMPFDYKLAWYVGGQSTSTLDQRQHSRKVTDVRDNPVYDAAIKLNSNNTSTQNLESIYALQAYGTLSGSSYFGAFARVLQRSAFSSSNAQFSYDIAAKNLDGTFSQVSLNGLGEKSFGPTPDNSISLGLGSFRWSVVYSATGAINTSDEREKTFLEIEDAEKMAALEIKQNLRKFKFNSSIEEKGENARIHFGASAQQVGEIMISHGLDPNRYGFYCYDEWDEIQEIKDNDGNIIQEYRAAGNRYGLRYEELLAFIISAI